MACHTPPLKEAKKPGRPNTQPQTSPVRRAKKQGGMPLPSFSLIPFKYVEFMGLRLGKGIPPC